jgi:hypothetical protein
VDGTVDSITCADATLCLAGESMVGDNAARVYVSTRPGVAGSWKVADAAPTAANGNGVTVACATSSLCFAADGTGTIAVGTPAPTTAQLRAKLRRVTLPQARSTTIRELLSRRQLRHTLTAPLTGTLSVSWHTVRPGQAPGRQELARGTARLIKGQRATITAVLTRLGRRVLNRGGYPATLAITGRLAPRFEPPVTIAKTITIANRS